MDILGLNYGITNSSSAICRDNKIIVGAPEERFNREKKTRKTPLSSIKFCLDYCKTNMENIDYVAQGWNPGSYWNNYNPLVSEFRSKEIENFYTIPDNLYKFTKRETHDWVLMDFPKNSKIPPVYHIVHHLCHASNAFFLSQFQESAILTVDYKGEFEAMNMGLGKDNSFEIFNKQDFPHSLGVFYSTFTELLGYRPGNDEWKVMALSSFDVDCKDYENKIRKTVNFIDEGKILLDQTYYKASLKDQPNLYTRELVKLLGNREGIKGEEATQWHMQVAKAMHNVSEEIATHMLRELYNRTKSKNISLSGGFFMNSSYNGKILEQTPFEKLYVSYAPTDLGNSIGSALYVAHNIKKQKRNYEFNSSFIGPEYKNNEVLDELNKRSIKFIELLNPAKDVAKLISDGEIIAVFNGRMEFGERALGNRSILADPRNPETKDKINSIIKYREKYRPFAPAILKEEAPKYFEVPNDFECNYMEKVVQIKKEFQKKLPAVTHVDGSGRIQTVSKSHNPFFYDLILEFSKISNFPILLNTSFNVNNEPIACSVGDALNTFYNSGLKKLLINNYLISK